MHSDPSPSANNQHRFTGSRRPDGGRWLVAAAIAMSLLSMPPATSAAPRVVAGTFTATTANMTPAGLKLRIQILEWQEADARSDVVATLAAGAEAATELAKLPTVGYVWANGSPVGYSLKYAHHAPAADGGERITLVTDRRLGSRDYKGWSVPSPTANGDVPYSVIELDVGGSGTGSGNLSLAAEVMLDEAAGTVSLATSSGAMRVLTDVKRETATP